VPIPHRTDQQSGRDKPDRTPFESHG